MIIYKITFDESRCIHFYLKEENVFIKGTLLGLRQFLATESLLKKMKNALYCISKALFVPKISKFLFWFFGHGLKRLD